MSTRPHAIIQADIEETQRAWTTCKEVVKAFLERRLDLLHAGWPVTHALCEALDADASRWAMHAEHQRHALLSLRSERDDQ